ncbi:MAG: cell division protein FtsQ, partial [Novosphingobium sp. 16-62-11]
IYEKILGQNDRAMTTLNLAALRDELNAISWVKDARVSRKLPDTLVIDIVERSPHAVLRKPDRLVLIDDTGAELETVKPDRAKGMLVLTGLGVGKRVQDLTHLLDAAPALKPQVAEAEWVGNRRWNLTFKTGQILVLPEGDEKSAGALLSFARMDGVNRLLGGKVAAFDMRAGDRIYMRVPGHAEEQAEEKRAAAQAKAEAKRIAAAARADEG